MAAAAAGTPVFLEVRTQLRSALLILGEPKEGGTPMDISITPSSLQVKTPADCTELRLPAEVRLVPSSCRGLQYVAGDGLHLRLQVWAESNAKLISMFNQSSQARECCTFYCQSCGEVVIRDSVPCLNECRTSTCIELLSPLECSTHLSLPLVSAYLNSSDRAQLPGALPEPWVGLCARPKFMCSA
uniref:E3 ubiquitin-protein ligase E3D n=1 Tax=Felis catus TaxID=9685 RepID=A0ABI7X7Q7_FELCA